ncbi:MAG: helix-turn-helix transcriptional regulator [Desulfuromonadales bacterium]|nr:helix-turn-helix transcriptional regulator [Desulfuromonadales bacterium]MDW7758712.1 helix-turn-helix transcriptional regulator [Desulfuromonadales bacterium]
MTQADRMTLLRQKVEEKSQAQVARELGYSGAAISQALSGKYQGDLTNLLNKVEEVYGASTVVCPVLGEIVLGKCAEHRRRPFAATNPLRVRLYRACKNCDAWR